MVKACLDEELEGRDEEQDSAEKIEVGKTWVEGYDWGNLA